MMETLLQPSVTATEPQTRAHDGTPPPDHGWREWEDMFGYGHAFRLDGRDALEEDDAVYAFDFTQEYPSARGGGGWE